MAYLVSNQSYEELMYEALQCQINTPIGAHDSFLDMDSDSDDDDEWDLLGLDRPGLVGENKSSASHYLDVAGDYTTVAELLNAMYQNEQYFCATDSVSIQDDRRSTFSTSSMDSSQLITSESSETLHSVVPIPRTRGYFEATKPLLHTRSWESFRVLDQAMNTRRFTLPIPLQQTTLLDTSSIAADDGCGEAFSVFDAHTTDISLDMADALLWPRPPPRPRLLSPTSPKPRDWRHAMYINPLVWPIAEDLKLQPDQKAQLEVKVDSNKQERRLTRIIRRGIDMIWSN